METRKIYTMKDIRESLQGRNIQVLSRNIGISPTTLYQIARGEHENITYEFYTVLVQHLFNVSIE
jgi:hypothetical protein